MRGRNQYSPPARARAQARVKGLTRAVIVVAGGATAFIGVVVAREHPGGSTGTKTPSTVTTTTQPGTPDQVSTTTTPTPRDDRPLTRRVELRRNHYAGDYASDECAYNDADDQPAVHHLDPAGRHVRRDFEVEAAAAGSSPTVLEGCTKRPRCWASECAKSVSESRPSDAIET